MVLRKMRRVEPVAANRRVYFQCVKPDGKTPAESENGQQPEISIDGATFTDAGIGTLAHCGHGRYYAELDEATLNAFPRNVETRYARTGEALETVGDSVEVAQFKPGDEYESGTVRAVNSAMIVPVEDDGLNSAGKYIGAVFVMVSGNRKGESDKVSAYVGTGGAKVITLTKGFTSNDYAIGDRFIIIGA